MTSHAPMPSVTKPARRPLASSNSNSNLVLCPPSLHGTAFSPNKSNRTFNLNSPLKHSNRKVEPLLMGPPSAGQRLQTDSMQKKGPQLAQFKTRPQKPMGLDASYLAGGKENVHPQMYPALPAGDMSSEGHYMKPNGKRALMEAAPITSSESRPQKKSKTEDSSTASQKDTPRATKSDDKPPHSYAQLIGMAILSSPNRRLTLAQIYASISSQFSYYNPNDSGWQNSIRHNLSLHKNFIKVERPKDDPGKGHYWTVEPGTEGQFLKQKLPRKPQSSGENVPVMSTRMEPSGLAPAPMPEPSLPPQPLSRGQVLLPGHQTFTVNEPSSDATIAMSETEAQEQPFGKQPVMDVFEGNHQSPLPGALLSSPPIPKQMQQGAGTPPPMRHQRGSSIHRPAKRDGSNMDDSGYISSLESSALRPVERPQLNQDLDRPRRKKQRFGPSVRAEDEIIRIRSSPFSPTKTRSKPMQGLVSSSPVRQAREPQAPQPITPLVRRQIMQAPSSVSPATLLAAHRTQVHDLLKQPTGTTPARIGDPAKFSWSPAPPPGSPLCTFDDLISDVFGQIPFDDPYTSFEGCAPADDDHLSFLAVMDSGSPTKRTGRRGQLERSFSTPQLNTPVRNDFLGDVPSLKLHNASPQEPLQSPSKALIFTSPSRFLQESPMPNNSPTKGGHNSFLDTSAIDWDTGFSASATLDANGENGNTECGLDIMQGFAKIGSGGKGSGPTG